MFERLDEDNSGEVTRDEIERMNCIDRAKLQELMTSGDPDEIFEMLDVDGSGAIGIDEFCDCVWQICNEHQLMVSLKRIEKFSRMIRAKQEHTDQVLRDLQRSIQKLSSQGSEAQAHSDMCAMEGSPEWTYQYRVPHEPDWVLDFKDVMSREFADLRQMLCTTNSQAYGDHNVMIENNTVKADQRHYVALSADVKRDTDEAGTQSNAPRSLLHVADTPLHTNSKHAKCMNPPTTDGDCTSYEFIEVEDGFTTPHVPVSSPHRVMLRGI